MRFVKVYTDGSTKTNPGKGGWASVVEEVVSNQPLLLSYWGMSEETTSNRMELTAVITTLEFLIGDCHVDVYTDSQYVAVNYQKYLKTWVKNDYKNVKNSGLWKRLKALSDRHVVFINWVKGHSGHQLNEHVDQLARLAALDTETLKKLPRYNGVLVTQS